MTITNQQRELERTRFWQGQALLSRDFNDLLDIEAHRRWWHNRGLHDAYGIANGFDVIPPVDNTITRATLGHIGTNPPHVKCPTVKEINVYTQRIPSVAYDCFGRELILQRASKILPPPANNVEKWWSLFANYRSSSDVRGQQRAGCLTRIEEPEFRWHPIRKPRVQSEYSFRDLDFDVQHGVPIALADSSGTLKNFHKPPVRPLARPYIASNCTIKGRTNWQLWPTENNLRPVAYGVQITIDTSAAGFATTPCYFASLQGPPPEIPRCKTKLNPTVNHTTPTSFVFVVWTEGELTKIDNNCPAKLLEFAQRNLYVCWHAVEPVNAVKGC